MNVALGARVDVATPTDSAALAAASLVLLDGLMSIPLWGLEGNPVVLAIGAAWMMATKVAGVGALLWLWFADRGARGSIIAASTPWILLVLHAAVVGTNAVVAAAVVL